MKINRTKNCLCPLSALKISIALLALGVCAHAKDEVMISPPVNNLQNLVQEAYSKFKEENGGKNAQ